MTDSELFHKASQAGYDYRTVHGSFPDKIGIHYQRLQSFPYRHIIFPERTELPAAVFFSLESPPLESITFRQHMAMFEPVIGKSIEYDEVYLPIPGEERGVISATQLGYLAAEQEREEKFFYAIGSHSRRRKRNERA
jgi:hypothetical protein